MAYSGPFSKFTDVIPYIESTIGVGKEVWLVFDMDETLAYWDFYLPVAQKKVNKELSAEAFFNKHDRAQGIIRPSAMPFFNTLLAKGFVINFAIYSNTQKKGRVELIAEKMKGAVGGNPNFRVCFLFYNHFLGNPAEVEPKRLNVNVLGLSQYYDPKKTMETIRYGFKESGHPVDESALFFFDDKEKHTDILSAIGKQYILMEEYKGKGKEESSGSGSFFSRGPASSGSASSGPASSGPAAAYVPPPSSVKRGFTKAFEVPNVAAAVPTTGKYVPPSMYRPANGAAKGGRRRTRRTHHRSKKTQRARRRTH
jgi:hypothetical protein